VERSPDLGGAIGILYHPLIAASQSLGSEVACWLEARGRAVWQGSGWDEQAIQAHIDRLGLLITLGGDGTILRAARMGAPYRIPILAINMGRLGFLAETQPDAWRETLSQVLQGGYWLEQRLMLSAELWRDGERRRDCLVTREALNDVVISRGRIARMIRLSVHIDGADVTTYACDGLIASTATGCTAYALSCGGPVLPPELRSILLVPIAPHLSLDRAIVLPEGASVSIDVSTDHEAILTIDGQSVVELAHDDRIVVEASRHSALFLRTQGKGYFYRTLMARLGNSRLEERAD
jgi:NAD+ kinase